MSKEVSDIELQQMVDDVIENSLKDLMCNKLAYNESSINKIEASILSALSQILDAPIRLKVTLDNCPHLKDKPTWAICESCKKQRLFFINVS